MGLKLAGVMMILMLAMGGLGYWYYNDSQEKMRILHENNAKLETAAKIQTVFFKFIIFYFSYRYKISVMINSNLFLRS